MTTTTTTRARRARTYCRTTTHQRPTSRNEILLGDALAQLKRLPTASVDTVITSPPYFLLRNYGMADQLGAEETVHAWVDNLVAIADEIARLLAPHGSFWLNLGDSFSRHERYGAPSKSLLLGPERLLLALNQRGWIVRSKVVWAKPNPMPHSVRDRLSTTWEPIFHLVRSRTYYFDLDRIRVPHTSRRTASAGNPSEKYRGHRPTWAGPLAGSNDGLARARAEGRPGHILGKNPGDVWTIPTAGYRGAHFATFPVSLVERPLLATCPERVCLSCGTPWTPVHSGAPRQACTCRSMWRRGMVLDPFMGAGTVAVAAEQHGRDWLGIELNPAYRRLALERLAEH